MLVRRARIVAFLIFGLSGGADASQEGKDMKLEDMGFVMRAADTPAQIERLRQERPPLLSVRRSGLLQMRVRRRRNGDEELPGYGVAAAASADGDRPRQAVRRQ